MIDGEDNVFGASAPAGSAKPGPSGTSDGQPAKDASATVPKEQYDSLATKLGVQGQELGELRKFHSELTPLLEVLEADPELTQAILSGKINGALAAKVASGDISAEDAKEATKAVADAAKGAAADKAVPAVDVDRIVSAKVAEETRKMRDTLSRDITSIESKRKFEKSVDEFISVTEDFKDHANEINEWFLENPKQWDIRVAYEAVKGRAAIREAQARQAEERKRMVPGGGGSSGNGVFGGRDQLESLIGPARRSDDIF